MVEAYTSSVDQTSDPSTISPLTGGETERSPRVTPDSATVDFLRTVGLFSSLSAREIETLARLSRFTSLDSGQFLSTEGDEEGLYGFIVVVGRLALTRTSINGRELTLELLGPGDTYGLFPIPESVHHILPVSIRAQVATHLLLIPTKNLVATLNAHPLIYREITQELLNSLEATRQVSRSLAHDRVEVRIALALSRLALKFARTAVKVHDKTIDITRQQIADLTGTTSETAIRVTRAMQRNGIIDVRHPGVVRILDMKRLLALSHGE